MSTSLTSSRSIQVVMPKEQKSLKQRWEEDWKILMDCRTKLANELANVDQELRKVGAVLERLQGRAS